MTNSMPLRGGGILDWRRWTPYAAIIWSFVYAGLGMFWVFSGNGFPYNPETASNGMGPLLERFGSGTAWIVVFLAGIPAVALGVAMLRGVRKFRPLLIASGALLAGVLLFLMTGLNLLVMFGYIPYAAFSFIKGAEFSQVYVQSFAQWTVAQQLLCLTGGFLWLAATVCYALKSGDSCLYCGRQKDTEGWNSPVNAARWGRIAVYISLVAPVFYAITRYAWALGLPLGMSVEYLRSGQENGIWVSGLSMATFGLVGSLLAFGLVQRWGEIFPRWMIGLAGRRVPMALAFVPVGLISALLVAGGIGIWSALPHMVTVIREGGAMGFQVFWEVFIQVGPTLLFPVWGVALAVAALGYYYRRRGPCHVCGRGGSQEIG